MATRLAITDRGREFLSRCKAREADWVAAGYQLFAAHKFGEGGWELSSGVKIPRDPELFIADNDLQAVINPMYAGDYVGTLRVIDQSVEIQYVGGAGYVLRVVARLEQVEENDDGTGNSPVFFEVGVFDNAFDIPLVQAETGVLQNNLVLYATFDAQPKTVTDAIEIRMDIPFKP
jgi:hypothetical protein